MLAKIIKTFNYFDLKMKSRFNNKAICLINTIKKEYTNIK